MAGWLLSNELESMRNEDFTSGIALEILIEITKLLRISRLCAEILTQGPHNTKEGCSFLDRDIRSLLVLKQCSLPCSQHLFLNIS
jgi:hypothetical protein